MTRVLLLTVLLISSTWAVSFGAPTGPDVLDTGIWVKHPGIAVGKLFKDDARMVVLAGDGSGKLHAWFPDGSAVTGFPKTLQNHAAALGSGGTFGDANQFVNSTPALVDIDGDFNLEIFVGSGDGYLYGFDNEGNNLPGWPVFTLVSPRDDKYGVFSSPAIADLDGDGTFEVIVGTWGHRIWVFNAEDGTAETGWPFDNLDTIWSSPAVLDADGDGDLEFVIGCDSTVPNGGKLRIFHHDGTELSGWPQTIDQVIWSTPAVGDIDKDGALEIVTGTGTFYGSKGEYVAAFELNGSPVTGWPVSILDADPATDNRVFSSPALADVTGDGYLETIVGGMDGYVRSIRYDGTILWSSSPATPLLLTPSSFAFFSSPAIGDIDGDGTQEVVIGGGWHLSVLDAKTGAFETGYPLYTGDLPASPYYTWSSPSIGDIDGDGKLEIAIGNGRKGEVGFLDVGGVRVYHEVGSSTNGGLMGDTGASETIVPWPRFRGNNEGTGSNHRRQLFSDVPRTHPFFLYIDRILERKVTAGCGSGNYCPDASVTRAQMAVFIEKALRSSTFAPPSYLGLFTDVPSNHWAAGWIEQLAQDQITAGCTANEYCPEVTINRAQMAVFLLKAKHGSTYTPPVPLGVFTDVPTNHWAAAWIEQLAAEQITAGCGGADYCPDAPVTRGQMAVFLAKALGL